MFKKVWSLLLVLMISMSFTTGFAASKPSLTFKSAADIYGIHLVKDNYSSVNVFSKSGMTFYGIYEGVAEQEQVDSMVLVSTVLSKDKKMMTLTYSFSAKPAADEPKMVFKFKKDSKGNLLTEVSKFIGPDDDDVKKEYVSTLIFKNLADLNKYLAKDPGVKKARIAQINQQISEAKKSLKFVTDLLTNGSKIAFTGKNEFFMTYQSDNVNVTFPGEQANGIMVNVSEPEMSIEAMSLVPVISNAAGTANTATYTYTNTDTGEKLLFIAEFSNSVTLKSFKIARQDKPDVFMVNQNNLTLNFIEEKENYESEIKTLEEKLKKLK